MGLPIFLKPGRPAAGPAALPQTGVKPAPPDAPGPAAPQKDFQAHTPTLRLPAGKGIGLDGCLILR